MEKRIDFTSGAIVLPLLKFAGPVLFFIRDFSTETCFQEYSHLTRLLFWQEQSILRHMP